ncbi:MAG TPA: AarF/ABC1/UbiB kinase family protein, partial [Polyangiaceae bacterium]
MVSILHAARDIGRVREISTVLVRHGFGEIVARLGLGRKKTAESSGEAEDEARGARAVKEMTLAVRARRVLEDLGPSFVKLGQLASTRPDVIPSDLQIELRKLQDSVPPIDFQLVKAQVEASLGAPLDAVFASFDKEPLAAASIAQVHRATLNTESGPVDVVVKVQRPGIAQTIASDVDLLHAFAALIERAIPESRIYSPAGVVQQFDQAINAELDFVAEADNARDFAKNFEEDSKIKFPRPYREASSKRVLTLEYIDGLKIADAVLQGYSGRMIARRAFGAVIQQIFEDGFFHADPHPGNVLVFGDKQDPSLGIIDLGMVARLSPKMRDHVVDVMVSAFRRDYEGIADALYAIGTPTKPVDMDAFRAEVSLLSEKYLGKRLKEIELSGMVRDLIRVGTKYGIEVPTEFMMVGKALMTVEGIGKEIDPDFDLMEEAKPLFSELLRKRYTPERIGNELLRRVERLTGATYSVPQQVQDILNDMRLGRLVLKTEDLRITRSADRIGRQVFS